MAKLNKSLLSGLSGALGKQLVFKQYKDKTVVTKYPDMSRVKPTGKQEACRTMFTEAVAYAKGISRDPAQKVEYGKRVKKGESVYQFALKEYLAQNKK